MQIDGASRGATATGPACIVEPDPVSGPALLDTSKEAVLARRYETVTERNLLRILRKVRRTSPQVAILPEDPDERADELEDELGSFFPEPRRG